MDAKITKNRLSRLLSYDWIKIMALALALVFAWWIVFRVTKTDMRPSQNFTVLSYYCNDQCGENYNDLLDKATGVDNVFSYEVTSNTPVDLSTYGEDQIVDYLERSFALSQPDVLLVPTLEYPKETSYKRTYLDNVCNRFFNYVYVLDPAIETSFFANLEKYLNQFYDGGYEAGRLNKDTVERNFRARIKEYKDRRFKKKAEIQAGLQEEILRIEKYRNALIAFYGYLNAGIIEFSPVQVRDGDGNVLWGKNNELVALNLCPDETKMAGLSKYVSYTVEIDGQKIKTAKDMHALIFRYNDVEPGYEYEALLYINYLIENSISV